MRLSLTLRNENDMINLAMSRTDQGLSTTGTINMAKMNSTMNLMTFSRHFSVEFPGNTEEVREISERTYDSMQISVQ